MRAIGRVGLVKTTVHLLLGTEGLDDTQATQCLLHLTHRVAPQTLSLGRVLLQLTTYQSHKPSHHRHDDQCEGGQLPRYKQHRREIGNDEDWVLEQHLERRHDGVLYLQHITTHACNDITFALFREESQWQRRDLLV